MLYILFISIIVVVFFSLCRSVKLFYPNPQVLHFPSDTSPHPTGMRDECEGDHVALCCQLGLKHNRVKISHFSL